MGDPTQDLHQGFFTLGLPIGWRGWLAMGLGLLLTVVATGSFLVSGTLVDAPPVGEVSEATNLDQVDASSTALLYKTDGPEGVWVRMPAKSVGTFGEAICTVNDEGEQSWSFYLQAQEVALNDGTVLPLDGNVPVNFPTQGCSDYTVRAEDVIEVLVFVPLEGETGQAMAYGAGVEGEQTARPLARQIGFTSSYTLFAFGFLTLMGATSAPGANVYRKMVKQHNPRPRLHKDAEGLRYAVAPEWEGDHHDWLFDPPSVEVWNRENPYAADNPEELLPEHPNKLGSLHLATFTMYTVWGLGFVAAVTAAGLYSDVAFGAGAAWITQILLFLLSSGVLFASWRSWKRLHSMIDTPTSTVRSVAVGPAELVGEVRPAHAGSLRVTVGTQQVPGAQVALTALTEGVVDAAIKQATGQNLAQHTVDGVVAYVWVQEVWETRTTGSGDNKSSTTKWWHEADGAGNTAFILHDGTGGILVDPGTWMARGTSTAGKSSRRAGLFGSGRSSFGFGPAVFTWQVGKALSLGSMSGLQKPRRWTMHCLRVGDPVYALGKVVTRSREEVTAEGFDGSTPSSNLRMVGEDDIGVSASMHRGTELSLMCSVRSTVEAIAVPVLMVIGTLLPLLS